ncbi:MAG TPA: GspE/PulE family protein [Thermoleophilaceae bacterium]|nr:GspE/PulE family protein [Thermoleophilaceae bacterium]
MIVQLGFAEREIVERVVENGRRDGLPLGQALIEAGLVNSSQLAQALAERNGLDYVDLNVFDVDKGATAMIDSAKARRYRTVPIAFLAERTLLVATADPANLLALDDITMATGYEVRRAVASPEHIDALIEQLGTLSGSVSEVEEEEETFEAEVIELRESADEAPIVKLVHAVIADAVRRGVSDVHFEPSDHDMRVRFRVDGVVFDSTTVPRHLISGLISRIKIMAELDIAEKRSPQDGRIGLSVDGNYVDLRVATLPTVRGEAVVMRVLDSRAIVMDLDGLGIDEEDRLRLEAALRRTHGAILVTGPTGSGKTTTLYAALGQLNTPDRTLVTVEDPVEYEIDGIKQVQVHPKAGLTFATGLRALLRADPDVLMVGEIRDAETAQIAIESALTGHLVMTTLHANDAPLAAARLVEMGVEPYLVTSSVECVVGQRLVRKLCDCKKPVKLSKALLEENGFEVARGISGFEPVGCVSCAQTGYKGRTGLYEVMTMSDEVRKLILDGARHDELTRVSREQGMRPLHEAGLAKVAQGDTSVPEVLRVLGASGSR